MSSSDRGVDMDKENLGKAVSTITHGVYVLGVHTEEKDNLMTAAWLCQVSSSPAVLAVAVSAGHLTAELIPKAGRFTVSVLGSGQREAALACGRVSGRTADKTKKVNTEYTENGIPMIAGAAARMECRVLEVNKAADHLVILAEIERAEYTSDHVLLYHKKDFF